MSDTQTSTGSENANQSGQQGAPQGGTPAPEKKKRIPQARVDAKIDKSLDSVKNFVGLFNALPVQEKSGYDNYFSKEDGFVNPQAYHKLTPQGVAKMQAILIVRAAEIVAAGGEEAEEMEAAMHGLSAYQKVAATEAEALAKQAKIETGIKTLMDAFNVTREKAIEILSQQLGQQIPPTPSVAPAANGKQGSKKGQKANAK